MDIFLLYLWTRLDAINILSGIAMGVLLVVAAGMAINYAVERGYSGEKSEDTQWAKAGLSKFLKYALIPCLFVLLIPSQKDAVIIAGGWAVKQVATSEGAQQLSSKTFALINGKLDEELAKLNTKETK